MSRYKKGDRVEVLNTTLEHSWHPARIVEGRGELYTVQIDGHTYGSVVLVLVNYIRPCPPVVEFSNWSRGDLVHVFDNFAWKLATVLQVLEKKHLTVRVIGSMLDLIVVAAWIRVRHCWQDGRWIVVGKGPSISDERQPHISFMIPNSRGVQKKNPVVATRRKITCQKSNNVSPRLIKRNAPSSLDQTEARRKVAKVSRTTERHSPCTLNQTDTGTGTGMRSRLTEEPQGMSRRPHGTNVTANETHEKQKDCGMSCVGSCSINTDSSSHHYSEKFAEHHYDGYVSDAESRIGPSHKPGSQTGLLVVHKGWKALDRRGRGYRNCHHL